MAWPAQSVPTLLTLHLCTHVRACCRPSPKRDTSSPRPSRRRRCPPRSAGATCWCVRLGRLSSRACLVFFFSVECSTAHSLSSRRVVLVGRAPLTSCATLSPHAPPILLPAGHRQDWQRQDSCLCAAHAGAHHGPARASGDSWGVAGFSRLCHLLLLMWRKVGVNWWPARAAGEGQMGRL